MKAGTYRELALIYTAKQYGANKSTFHTGLYGKLIIFLNMLISIEIIYDWAGTNLAQGKFFKGERDLDTADIKKCGKNPTSKSNL